MRLKLTKLALLLGATYFALDLWKTRQQVIRKAAGESDYEHYRKFIR